MPQEAIVRDGVCLRVVDGDTAVIAIDLPVRDELKLVETLNVRFYGINTPELHSTDSTIKQQALAAKQFLSDLLTGKQVKVEIKGTDKYGGRVDGTVFLLVNGAKQNVNQLMVDKGFAKPYFGGARDFPRRCDLLQLTPAELVLRNAMLEIEALGAHPLLTDVVCLLDQAREKLADWVELSVVK